MSQWLIDFWKQHGVVGVLAGWTVLSSLANVLTRVKSPTKLVELLDKFPAAHALFTVIRGFGVDPVALIEAFKVYAEKQAQQAEQDANKDKQE